jgi:hypothetical protein
MSAKRKRPKRRKRPRPKWPTWMLVRKGFLSRIMADVVGDGVMRRCWPVFFSREDARSFIDPGNYAEGLRPAEIGSFDCPLGKESFSTLVAAAVDDDCEFMVAMHGRREDGEIIWGIADLTPDQRWKEVLAKKFQRTPS